MISIRESGMTFGPFQDSECFRVETSQLYAAIQGDVKIAEFVLLRSGTSPAFWIMEAKSSSPRPETQPNFDEFVTDIRDKWVNAFSLVFASCLERHPVTGTDFPTSFQRLDLSKIRVRFCLVINGHKDEWLPGIQDALNKALRPTAKTWALGAMPVCVINEEGAQKYGLTQ